MVFICRILDLWDLLFSLYSKTQEMDFHLSTIFVSTGLFMMAMVFPSEKPRGASSVVAYIGRRLSMWIYLLHMWCSSVLERIIDKIAGEYESIYAWLKPILVCLFACLLAFTISGIQEKMRNRRLVSTANGTRADS